VKQFLASTARLSNRGSSAAHERKLGLWSLDAAAALLLCAAIAAPAVAWGAPGSAAPAAQPATASGPAAATGTSAPEGGRAITGPSFLDSPDAVEAPGSALPNVGITLARLVGATLLIVAVLVGGALLFKRFAKRALNFSRGADSPLRVVERLALGPKNQVCLIQACGRYLVIGVTEKEINVLMEVTPAGDESVPGEFAAMLSGVGEKLRGRPQN
jgi:flagellar biosynthetic protein FliO